MRMAAYVGIDPGQTGAIAIVDTDGSAEVHDWPGDAVALARLLAELDLSYDVVIARIERQSARPMQGVSSTFKLGVNYGIWLAACAARLWRVEVVTTKAWRVGRGYPQKRAGAPQNIYTRKIKEHSLTTARQIFPGLAHKLTRKKDHGRAEALLIAYSAMEAPC